MCAAGAMRPTGSAAGSTSPVFKGWTLLKRGVDEGFQAELDHLVEGVGPMSLVEQAKVLAISVPKKTGEPHSPWQIAGLNNNTWRAALQIGRVMSIKQFASVT